MRCVKSIALLAPLTACFLGVHESPISQQRNHARTLAPDVMPAALGRPTAERAQLRVRAYVHEDFRSGLVDPEGRIQQTLADASAVLGSQVRIGLDLVEILPWPGDVGSDLHGAIEALQRLDPAHDVDIVAGFIGKVPRLTDQLHAIGMAKFLGHHIVTCGSDDAAEVRAIDGVLSRMTETERSELIATRRRHKASVVFVHEVAHVLGGVHVGDPESILFPIYSVKQSFLNDDALVLLEHGLAFHRAPDDAARAMAATQLREQIEARRSRLAQESIDGSLESLPQPPAQPTEPGDGRAAIAHASSSTRDDASRMPHEQSTAFNAALADWRRGEVTAAWTSARSLARAADAHPRALILACQLAGADGVVAMDGPALCDRAMRASQPPHPHALEAAVAAARVAVRSKADAGPAFAEAKARTTGAPIDQVVGLAALARTTDRYALVEHLLHGLDDQRARELLADTATARRRSGLPTGRLAPEEEPAFQQALRDVYDALEAAPPVARAQATQLLDAANARFGDISGLLSARCDLLRRTRAFKDAEKACARALELMPDASFAHVILALVHAEKGRRAQAIALLERALELDPSHEQTRRLLDQVRASR